MIVLEALLALIAAGLGVTAGVWCGFKIGDLYESWQHKQYLRKVKKMRKEEENG